MDIGKPSDKGNTALDISSFDIHISIKTAFPGHDFKLFFYKADRPSPTLFAVEDGVPWPGRYYFTKVDTVWLETDDLGQYARDVSDEESIILDGLWFYLQPLYDKLAKLQKRVRVINGHCNI